MENNDVFRVIPDIFNAMALTMCDGCKHNLSHEPLLNGEPIFTCSIDQALKCASLFVETTDNLIAPEEEIAE